MKLSELEFITIGEVQAPWGNQGKLKVKVLTDFPERFAPSSTVYINQQPMTIAQVEWQKGNAIIKLNAVDSVAAAQGLKGQPVEIHHSQLKSLPEGQYYHFQLIGLEVWTAQGELLGTVTEILTAPSNDIYIVQVRPLTALPEFFPHEFSGSDADITWRRDGVEPVEPFTGDIKGSELWARYREPAIGFVENRELDFNGYRYTTKYSWTPSQLGSDELEKWMDANEGRLRQAWLTAKQEMQESWPRALEAKAAGRSAAGGSPGALH